MSETLISYAQNGEDIVLWRALGHVTDGRYVDVGACDPVDLSVTKLFYDRGWRGIDIDPVPEYAARLLAARPGNEVVQAAITDRPSRTVTFHQLVGTGLSTLVDDTADAHEHAGYERRELTVPALTLDAVCEQSTTLTDELHLLKVDVEGAEAEVLRSFDLERWKPWVVVVEATKPLSTEPSYEEWDPILTEAGYTFTLFDGLSRFYASPHHPELVDRLSYPTCPLDDFVTARQHEQDLRVNQLAHEVSDTRRELIRWRNEAVSYWANAVGMAQTSENKADLARHEADRLRSQLTRVRENLQQVRDERNQLRERVKKMTSRIERMTARIERMTARREEQDPGEPVTRTPLGRFGAAVKKVKGS